MKIVYELIEGKPFMNNPILIENDAEIPEGHVELDHSKSYKETGEELSLVELDAIRNTPVKKSEVRLLQESQAKILLMLAKNNIK
jgi:hypothetical protein